MAHSFFIWGTSLKRLFAFISFLVSVIKIYKVVFSKEFEYGIFRLIFYDDMSDDGITWCVDVSLRFIVVLFAKHIGTTSNI